MGKKKQKEGKTSGRIELPAHPCFTWMPASADPPSYVLLLLACEAGYLMGYHDGNDYFDTDERKVSAVYGKVDKWCIFVEPSGKAVQSHVLE